MIPSKINTKKLLARAKQIPADRAKALLLKADVDRLLGKTKGCARSGKWQMFWVAEKKKIIPVFAKEHEQLNDFGIDGYE